MHMRKEGCIDIWIEMQGYPRREENEDKKKRGERVDREVRMETEMVERLKRSFQRVVRDIRTIDAEYTLPAASVILIPICISHAIKCGA